MHRKWLKQPLAALVGAQPAAPWQPTVPCKDMASLCTLVTMVTAHGVTITTFYGADAPPAPTTMLRLHHHATGCINGPLSATNGNPDPHSNRLCMVRRCKRSGVIVYTVTSRHVHQHDVTLCMHITLIKNGHLLTCLTSKKKSSPRRPDMHTPQPNQVPTHPGTPTVLLIVLPMWRCYGYVVGALLSNCSTCPPPERARSPHRTHEQ